MPNLPSSYQNLLIRGQTNAIYGKENSTRFCRDCLYFDQGFSETYLDRGSAG